jgi:hypothetical protein
MLPALWVDQDDVPLGEIVASCPRCGPGALRDASLEYSTVVWFFFGFVRRLDLSGTCVVCNQHVRLAGGDVPKAIRRRVPFLHRLGCATVAIVGVLSAAIMMVLNN